MANILLDKECEITPFKKVSFMKDVKEVNYVGYLGEKHSRRWNSKYSDHRVSVCSSEWAQKEGSLGLEYKELGRE